MEVEADAAEEEYANEVAAQFELEAEGAYSLDGKAQTFASQVPIPGVLAVIVVGLIALVLYGRRAEHGSLADTRGTTVGAPLPDDIASRLKTSRPSPRNPR